MLHSLVLSVALAARAALAPVDSARADSDIRLVALRHASEIQTCYETRGLRVNPDLRGVIEVSVSVSPTGLVENATITASDLEGAGRDAVEACITNSVRNWRFERGPYPIQTIVYPFKLVREIASAAPPRSAD